ncbi:hypothetical protein BU25DRAFT_439432 [Macroventuria anomochaeta]|uniref:Uncharacterized protein n=1 Tax=Macroventuria anomochaeta TaxID=301207 RepID=A0ACB6S2I6_9PLEO|nr:uncharacterized protein BU25DRAFT_439432 [Macroventuria anomochaeta]KAF2628455.1 hypothetical protein BU25DRAFT_439432 [Macroventuria anomochaeta]
MEEVAPAPPAPFDSATFNPWFQNVTMYAPDGSIMNVNMEHVNLYRLYIARVAISFGSQIGASVVLLLLLLLLTRSEKRKSSIFILNALCLFANSLRCIFLACYVTSGLMHPYTQLSGYPRATSTDLALSIIPTTLSLVVITLVMASLSLQTWVACVTTSNLQRILIIGVTTAMALVSVGFKFAFVVASNIAIIQLTNRGTDRLGAGAYITQAVAILLYSCVFTWKLGYAVIQRRRLKMLQSGSMQIVFIMGCQTMIIPAIFSTIQFYQPLLDKVPEVGTMVLTVLCIFLPLSAIWAGVANDAAIAHRGHDAHHHLINSHFGRGASAIATTDSAIAFDKSHHMSCSTCSYAKKAFASSQLSESYML